MKRCGCCGVTHNAASWATLSVVGAHDDGLLRMELRNCRCGSTLAVLVGASVEVDKWSSAELVAALAGLEGDEVAAIEGVLVARAMAEAGQ